MPRIKDVPRETTGKSQPEGETCSTWNVTAPRASKRGTRDHHSGRLRGIPSRRGHRSSASRPKISRTAPVSCRRTDVGGSKPRSASADTSHRIAASASGGSVTTSSPPARRKPAAHSATTAGDPNDRATTRSKCARRSGSRASTSARPQRTSTRLASPRSTVARSRNSHRRRWASSRTPRARGHASSRTRPGRPPPLPRSNMSRSKGPMRSARSEECRNCGSTGPGPSRPNRRASSRTSTKLLMRAVGRRAVRAYWIRP